CTLSVVMFSICSWNVGSMAVSSNISATICPIVSCKPARTLCSTDCLTKSSRFIVSPYLLLSSSLVFLSQSRSQNDSLAARIGRRPTARTSQRPRGSDAIYAGVSVCFSRIERETCAGEPAEWEAERWYSSCTPISSDILLVSSSSSIPPPMHLIVVADHRASIFSFPQRLIPWEYDCK